MRKILTICYLCLLVSFALPWFMGDKAERAEDGAESGPVAPEKEGASIRLLAKGEILELPMEEYLLGVLAAEMPASFPEQALMAQSVAARSYTLYCADLEKHDNAQVCAEPGCCQAWMDAGEMQARWGDQTPYYTARLTGALRATAGQYLSYQGQAICAAFHSSSAGATECSASIWSPTPYLVSVDSPETAQRVPELVSYAWISPGDMAEGLRTLKPGLVLDGGPENWIKSVQSSEGGRVDSLVIGSESFTGAQLRGLFSLRSTDFQMVYDGTGFAFTVEGYGHGVGMSQYGAKLMAEDGADYRQILAHYYPGTTLMG